MAAFAAELEAEVGRTVGYLPSGTLSVAVDDGDRSWTEELLAFQRAARPDAAVAHGRATPASVEPACRPGVRGAMWVAGDHQVHNRLLVGALLEAARPPAWTSWRPGATRVECTAATGTAVRLDDGTTITRAGGGAGGGVLVGLGSTACPTGPSPPSAP